MAGMIKGCPTGAMRRLGVNTMAIREYVYTIREAAHVLSVNRDTVRRWVNAGKLSGESIGGAVLLPRWAVEMLKEEREQASKRKRRRRRAA